MKIKPFWVYLFIFLAGALFFYKMSLYIDPDLGWQLRTGEYILKHGFPRIDPFSYTMPYFPLVAHSWLSDIAFFQLYSKFGMVWLNILVSAAAALTLLIILGNRWKVWTCIPALLFVGHLLPYVGTRPQTFSWLFFAILLKVIFNEKLWERYKKFLPILLFIWAQVHGAFFIALLVLAIQFIDRSKRTIENFFLFTTCVGITLLNPYGVSLWREVFTTSFSLTTRLSVNEWAPTITQLDARLALIFSLTAVLLVKYWRKLSTSSFSTIIVLTVMMLISGKFFPFWLVGATFFMKEGFVWFVQDIRTIRGAVQKFGTLTYALVALSIINTIVLAGASIRTYSQLSGERYYPQKAVIWLRDHTPEGNIFAPFGWGGYLLWKLPEKRVFIDGRMPHWENILEDYHEIISLEQPFDPYAESYSIDMVLVQKNRTNFMKFAENLQKEGWKKVYEDDISLILARGDKNYLYAFILGDR